VAADFDELPSDAFGAPAYRAVHEAIRAAGGLSSARVLVEASGGSTGWVGAVIEEAAEPVRSLVTELAVAPLPEDRPESLEGYVKGVVLRLVEIGVRPSRGCPPQNAIRLGRNQSRQPLISAVGGGGGAMHRAVAAAEHGPAGRHRSRADRAWRCRRAGARLAP